MKIKRIEFAHEIRDPYMDNVDVFVENEDGYTYTIVVSTPGDLVDQMEQEKINFIYNCITSAQRQTVLTGTFPAAYEGRSAKNRRTV